MRTSSLPAPAVNLARREILVQFDRTQDPVRNLRREEEIFGLVEDGNLPEFVRFWTNTECLVRGRVRHARYGWYDQKLAEELGVPVLVRSTGGGVVYHDLGNLNWSFFLRTSGAFLSPTAVFGRASKYLIEALGSLGVPAQFSPPNRIDVSGRKVSGMAARSTVHTILVHGTLLLNSDLDRLNLLCMPPAGCPPVSNLSEWLASIDNRSVIDRVKDSLEASGLQPKIANGQT